MTRTFAILAVLAACGRTEHAASTRMAPVPSAPPEQVVDYAALAQRAADGTIGSAHPTKLLGAAGDGSWVAICQAREDSDGDGQIGVLLAEDGAIAFGDKLHAYFVIGSGLGIPFDYIAARSADGAWVALVRDKHVELFDAKQRRAIALHDADARDDGIESGLVPFGQARAASIARDGSRMLYLRHTGDRDQVVIRELASGIERVVDVAEPVRRAEIDDDARWARITIGRWEPLDYTRPGCTTLASPQRPSAGAVRWLDLQTGKLLDDPEIKFVIGDEAVRVKSDDSLWLGTDRLADASCHADVVGFVRRPARVLFDCGAPFAKKTVATPPLVVGGHGVHVQLTRTQLRNDRRDLAWLREHGRYDCEGTTCIDLTDGAKLELPGKLWKYDQTRAIARRGSELVEVTFATREQRKLADVHGEIEPSFSSLITVDGHTIDGATGRQIHADIGNVLTLRDDGAALVAAGRTEPQAAWSGPLRWLGP